MPATFDRLSTAELAGKTSPKTMNRYFIHPVPRAGRPGHSLFSAAEYEAVRKFYLRQQFPATPMLRLPGLARALNVGEIFLKDESQRSTLHAFKLLGVEYAVQRLRESGRLAGNSHLVCATDGNHGRAVAHVAQEYGCPATVFVPGYTVRARIEAIENEGAEVVVVDEGYDAAILEAARFAEREGATVVSDTSWPGYEEIPRWIMAGYTQIMEEAAGQWLPDAPPDLVFVQVGVGGLAGAVVSWLCHYYSKKRPFVISCEPAGAACLLESLRAGKRLQLQGSLPTIMAGLRCGQVSMVAWPLLSDAVDAAVAVTDDYAARAMQLLARPKGVDPVVEAGESGACGLAALLAVLQDTRLRPVCEAGRIGSASRILFLNTEGATDPELYHRMVIDAAD